MSMLHSSDRGSNVVDKQSDRNTDRYSDRDSDRNTGMNSDRNTGMNSDRLSDRDTDRISGRDSDRNSGRDTDRISDRSSVRDSDKHSDKNSDKDSDRQIGTTMPFDRFLSDDYRPTGSVLRLQDDTEFYGAGNPRSKSGIILIPDTWGWNSGRIRNLADYFGENNCFAVVPRTMGSTKEGGETLAFTESSSIGEYIKSQTFDGNIKPKITSLVQYMLNQGIEKVALMGFSWGGWVALNILASDLGEHFACGILPHPSMNLEERVYGGSLAELFSRVQRPLLLLPARGDPVEYDFFVKLLGYKCPTSRTIDFRHLEHNYLLRGRTYDHEIRNACIQSVDEIMNFLNHHFQTDMGEFVRDFQQGGHVQVAQPDAQGRKSWVQSGKEVAGDAQRRVEEGTERVKHGTQETGQKVGDYTKDTGEYLKKGFERTGENIKKTFTDSPDESDKRKHYESERDRGQAGSPPRMRDR